MVLAMSRRWSLEGAQSSFSAENIIARLTLLQAICRYPYMTIQQQASHDMLVGADDFSQSPKYLS